MWWGVWCGGGGTPRLPALGRHEGVNGKVSHLVTRGQGGKPRGSTRRRRFPQDGQQQRVVQGAATPGRRTPRGSRQWHDRQAWNGLGQAAAQSSRPHKLLVSAAAVRTISSRKLPVPAVWPLPLPAAQAHGERWGGGGGGGAEGRGGTSGVGPLCTRRPAARCRAPALLPETCHISPAHRPACSPAGQGTRPPLPLPSDMESNSRRSGCPDASRASSLAACCTICRTSANTSAGGWLTRLSCNEGGGTTERGGSRWGFCRKPGLPRFTAEAATRQACLRTQRGTEPAHPLAHRPTPTHPHPTAAFLPVLQLNVERRVPHPTHLDNRVVEVEGRGVEPLCEPGVRQDVLRRGRVGGATRKHTH